MPVEISDEDRAWAADKRDFVADAREEAADAREDAADSRESAADAREAELDEREERLDVRSRELGIPGDHDAAQARTHAAQARSHARHERADLASVRREERARRGEVNSQRQAEDQPTLLALAFATIAEHLYEAPTYEEVLARIAAAAVATVAGGEAASVTLVAPQGYRTAGSTSETAIRVDQAQYDVDEGPCLDALSADPVVSVPSFPDQRWPELGAVPTEFGVNSSVSYQLQATRGGGAVGSLNVYGLDADAFDEDAIQIGSILAAHASVAARAVGERANAQQLDRHLEQALLSRDVIGQAKGILMERLKTTPDKVFEILRSASQRLNLKLREVARSLSETGELPGRDAGES